MKRFVCIGTWVLALGLIAVSSAHAAGRISVQTSVDPAGIGHLYAPTSSATVPPLVWELCEPDLTGCERLAGGTEVETTGAPAGSVFRVKDSGGEVGLSPEWKGRVKPQSPPLFAGVLAANEFVSPVPGLWSGGWRNEDSEMQLSACASKSGAPEECVALTDTHLIQPSGCTSTNSFIIESKFAGRYLRVANRRSGGPHIEALVGVVYPFASPVWRQSRNTSVAVVGQIGPTAHEPTGPCGPPPPPAATISAEGVARVECAGGCKAALVGMRNGRRRQITSRIPRQDLLRRLPALEMQLTHDALASLGAGKIRLAVDVDGTRLAQRMIRVSHP